jgi:uncharacterized Zn finger protein
MATPQAPLQNSTNADVTPTGVPDYRKSRAIRQFYEAKLAKLEIDVREGRLVDVDEINRETFNRARRVRDRLLMIPRRLAAQIAAEPDAHAIEDLLDAAFKDALEDMASAETTLPLGRKRIPGETNS